MRIQSLLGMVFVFCCILPRAGAQPSATKTSSEVYGNRPNMQLKAAAPSQAVEPTAGIARVSDTSGPSIHIAVMGQVRKPGVFEFQDGIPDLEELVTLAGGLTRFAAREFYVLSKSRPLTELEPSRHLHFPFEHGDVLLVETPARYYERLGQPSPDDITLADIHPVTQLVLLDVIDRPVIFKLPSSQARLTGLLTLLNQTANAAAGVRVLEPPHASRIPSSAKFAPGLLPSGSVLVFSPTAVDRRALPELPAAHRVPRVEQILPAAHETLAAPLRSRDGNVIVNPPSQPKLGESGSASPTEFVPLAPINRSLEGTAPGVKNQLARELAQDTTANANDALPDAFGAPPVPEEKISLLTSRQRGYVLVFLGLVTLCGAVLWIRRRGTGESRPRGLVAVGSAAHAAPSLSPLPARPVVARRPLHGLGDKTPVANDPPAPKPETPVATFAPPAVENSAPHAPTAPSLAPAFPPVPETIMDRILLEELIDGRIALEPEPVIEERVEIASEEPVVAATAAVEPPPVATTAPAAFRVDAPHNAVPQPLFPIIWNTPAERPHEPADIRRFVPETDEATGPISVPPSESSPAALTPSTSESRNPLDGENPPQRERRSLLYRALLAARRERNK